MALNKILLIGALVGLFAGASPALAEDVGCCKKFNPPDPQGVMKVTTEDATKEKCEQIASQYEKTEWVPNMRAINFDCAAKLNTSPLEPGGPVEFTPQVTVPGSQYAAGQSVKLADSTKALGEYIIAIFKYSIGIIGIISAIVLMFGGIRWLTAGGNGSAIDEAKTYIAGSLSGLILTLGSFLLLSTINLKLTELTVTPVKRIQYVSFEMGCCLKTDKADPSKITAETMGKEACEKIDYATTTFTKDYIAFTDDKGVQKCVADKGCCIVKVTNNSQWGQLKSLYNNIAEGDPFKNPAEKGRFCFNMATENICKSKNSSFMARGVKSMTQGLMELSLISKFFTDSKILDQSTVEFQLDKKCQDIPDCEGVSYETQ